MELLKKLEEVIKERCTMPSYMKVRFQSIRGKFLVSAVKDDGGLVSYDGDSLEEAIGKLVDGMGV